MGPMRYGYSLIELITVVVLMVIIAAIALPPLARQLDAAAVNEAAERYLSAHHSARKLAMARGRLVRLELDTARGTAALAVRRPPAGWDTVEIRPFGTAQLETSQPVITFAPWGVGFGLSNSRIVFRRGQAAETLTVSRTGRVRR